MSYRTAPRKPYTAPRVRSWPFGFFSNASLDAMRSLELDAIFARRDLDTVRPSLWGALVRWVTR